MRSSPRILAGAAWYLQGYVRRHFHAIRVSRAGAPPADAPGPLIIYLNHASWWDPLVLLLITRRFFPARTFIAPIDAAALQRYRVLELIGLFGVEQGTLKGARQFLSACTAHLARPEGGLCLTPQGRFADVRERPPQFEPGLGQLARRLERATFVPLALEYIFWEERLPELLVRFGLPISGAAQRPAKEWSKELERGMTATQDALGAEAMARDSAAWTPLVAGGAGVGGVYDAWRRMKARLGGKPWRAEHGSL